MYYEYNSSTAGASRDTSTNRSARPTLTHPTRTVGAAAAAASLAVLVAAPEPEQRQYAHAPDEQDPEECPICFIPSAPGRVCSWRVVLCASEGHLF